MIWNVFPRWSHQKIGFKTYLKRHRMKMHEGLDFFNRQWGLQNTTGRHRNLVKPSTEKFDPQSLSPWSVGGRSGKKMSLGLISSSSNGSRNCLIEWLGDIHIYIHNYSGTCMWWSSKKLSSSLLRQVVFFVAEVRTFKFPPVCFPVCRGFTSRCHRGRAASRQCVVALKVPNI